MRVLPALLGAAFAALASSAACDSSLRVGELRVDPADAGPLAPPAPKDASVAEATWHLHAPIVPCSIYAMGEARTDDLYLGCNGGRVYRFDGVSARLSFGGDETSVFSLLWVAPDGRVWAGAQTGAGPAAKTALHRFDGAKWTTVALPPGASRVTSITGTDAASLWIATETEILRYDGEGFVSKHTAAAGAFRACAFASESEGYCVGTGGLAVAWDGQTFAPMTGAPWSTAAEIYGVEIDGLGKTAYFVYGEPKSHPNGDHECRIARLSAGAFTPLAAAIPCFTDFRLARKRTGKVFVEARTFVLLSPDDQYGGALLFDVANDTVRRLCGPVLAFSTGLANTRAAGLYGLLATLVGAGGGQVALSQIGGTSLDFSDLSIAADGAAWARVEDRTACGSISDRLVRFEGGEWRPVAGPQGAQSGRGLAAVSRDHAYTIDLAREVLLEHEAGTWREGPVVADAWTLFAKRADDVWVGTYREGFGRFDGDAYAVVRPNGRARQVEQILVAGEDVWTVVTGVTAGDTDTRVVRWSNGEAREWNVGLDRVRVSALDGARVFRSGAPAHAWSGQDFEPLPLDATGVWARSPSEIYFTDRGDIYRWDGARAERVYHGFIPIQAIEGSADRGFAVGPGGLTLELGVWPADER